MSQEETQRLVVMAAHAFGGRYAEQYAQQYGHAECEVEAMGVQWQMQAQVHQRQSPVSPKSSHLYSLQCAGRCEQASGACTPPVNKGRAVERSKPNSTIYVSGINDGLPAARPKEEQAEVKKALEDRFAVYGAVARVEYKGRDCGYVKYEDPAAMRKAIAAGSVVLPGGILSSVAVVLVEESKLPGKGKCGSEKNCHKTARRQLGRLRQHSIQEKWAAIDQVDVTGVFEFE